MVTFLDAVVEALTAAGAYNRNDQEAPLAVLWTDRERQWAPLLPRLRERLPVLTLGQYDPATWTGPAIWVRAVLARALPEPALPADVIPILYLPGVARTELRAIEDCPESLQPLAFLQYRGPFWSQRSGRDWTVTAFLQNAQDGLGIEVGTDAATREALLRALTRLADIPVESLRQEAPLRAAFFDGLFVQDQARDLLAWMNDPRAFRAGRTPEAWDAFCAIALQQYKLDPNTATPIDAALHLGERSSERWEMVWQQFALTPEQFPAIPDYLRQAKPASAQLPLFVRNDAWPQENEAAEDRLREALAALDNAKAVDARGTIKQLESEHGIRRSWVWAKLGQAPLARALEHLADLAITTERVLGGATLHEICEAYSSWGWRADAAALRALAAVERQVDLTAVAAAVCALYQPWLEQTAIAFQQAALNDVRKPIEAPVSHAPGTCVIFVDGLRYDLAQRLRDFLQRQTVHIDLAWRLAPFPGVTPTAKPAVSPAAGRVAGGPGFDTVVQGGATRVTADVLRRLIGEAGWQVLSGQEPGDPKGFAWTEIGRLDSLGHELDLALARQADAELRLVAERILGLLEVGWQRVVVVTDHGWLLLPGGMPKIELPEHLTELRKGRCARLRDNARVQHPTLPWHWDPSVRVAVAPGISCFEAGMTYAHGGLSPQECVIPVMTIARTANSQVSVSVQSVTWRGLRCTVQIASGIPGLMVDIRLKAGDSATSIADQPKVVDSNGQASPVVLDEDREGHAAHVVVLDERGAVIAQVGTTVGGE